MSTFTTSRIKSIRTIKQGDAKFLIPNGVLISHRASIEIDAKCPDHYAQIILTAYSNGWLKSAVHFTEKEYILLGLNSD